MQVLYPDIVRRAPESIQFSIREAGMMKHFSTWQSRVQRKLDHLRQWAHRRTKDIAWLRQRRSFAGEIPRLLSEHDWVFLVGCNNSGTTLIHDVLAASNGFSHMPHEGQRYTDVLRRAHRRGHERVWTEYLDDLRLDTNDAVEGVERLIFDWVTELVPPINRRILEKTTANAARMTWLQSTFPNAAFIGVIRNGLAVVEGIKRKGRKSVERGAKHWVRVNEIMLGDSAMLDRFLLVRYEDFVTSPGSTLERLSTFLSVSLADLQEGFMSIDRNGSTGQGGSIADQNHASIQRLDESEIGTIKRYAAPLLAKYGYDAT